MNWLKKILLPLLLFPVLLSGQNKFIQYSENSYLNFWNSDISTSILPEYLVNNFALWIDSSESTSEYYIDKIGDNDRNALGGEIRTGNSIVYDSDKSQRSQSDGAMPDKFTINQNSLTFSLWFKIDSLDATQFSWLFGTNSGASGNYYCLTQAATGILRFQYNDSNGNVLLNSDDNVCDNEWHHLIVVLDKTSNASLYIDNVLQGTPISLIGKAFTATTKTFYIGQQSTAYYGKLSIRDFRLFDSAVTDDSLYTELYNQNYVDGVYSWWMFEDGNYSSTKKLLDCADTNHLNNVNFDTESNETGNYKALYNTYGYNNTAYEGADLFQGDGDFLDNTQWTYNLFLGRWSFPNDGSVSWGAIDDAAPNLRNNRTINFSKDDVFKMTFELTSGTANFSLNEYPSGQIVYAADDYSVGTHEVIFKMLVDGTGLQLRTNVAGGAWTMENLSIVPYIEAPIPPLMTSATPTTDINGNTLILSGTAKRNVFKVPTDSVHFPDSLYELFSACNFITVNDWYDTTGAANNINWNDIEYQSSRQYFGNGELIIIKEDVELTEAEDQIIKNYLGISLAYNPFYNLDVSLGSLSGTTTEIYASQVAIRDSYDASEKTFMQSVVQELDPEGDYIAVGWADWFPADYLYTAPMSRKYGFTNSFYRQIVPATGDIFNSNKYDVSTLKQIEKGGSRDANHSAYHFSSASNHPMADGRTIPSNYSLRNERSDGTNKLGHNVDSTVDASVTAAIRTSWMRLSDNLGSTTWANLTDSQCDSIRNGLSVYGAPYDPQNYEEMIQTLDILSERYCGTTGLSVYDDYTTRTPNTTDGLEPSPSNKIIGGIFQGAATTQNHEIWERLLIISYNYKKEFEGKTKPDLFWTTPGGTLFFHFKKENETGNLSYKDSTFTHLLTGGASFTSSITNEDRCFYDVLADYGYLLMIAAQGDGYGTSLDGLSVLESSRIYKKNGIKKLNTIGDGYTNSLRLWDASIPQADQNSLLDSSDMVRALYNYTATNARYDGVEPLSNNPPFNKIVNYIAKYNAWGLTPNFGGDAGSAGEARSSYLLVLETIYQYCKRAGIKVVSHEEAFLLSQNYSLPSNYNYWPNSEFKITPLEVTGSSNSVIYADGWNGGSVDNSDTSLYLGTDEIIFTRQYSINPGTYNYSFEAKGDATFYVRKIKNNNIYSDSGDGFQIINTVNVSTPGSYTEYTGQIVIPDEPLEIYAAPTTPEEEAYQNYMQQYGDKICGIQIELVVTGGNEVNIKNPSIIIN